MTETFLGLLIRYEWTFWLESAVLGNSGTSPMLNKTSSSKKFTLGQIFGIKKSTIPSPDNPWLTSYKKMLFCSVTLNEKNRNPVAFRFSINFKHELSNDFLTYDFNLDAGPFTPIPWNFPPTSSSIISSKIKCHKNIPYWPRSLPLFLFHYKFLTNTFLLKDSSIAFLRASWYWDSDLTLYTFCFPKIGWSGLITKSKPSSK